MATEKLFVRKASGLVRGMTGTDALIGNMLLANLIVSVKLLQPRILEFMSGARVLFTQMAAGASYQVCL